MVLRHVKGSLCQGGAEVRLDANKAARFNVSVQSTDGFDRLLPHTERRLPLP
jgi:hypothetical protein